MIFSLTLQKTTDMLLRFTLSNFRSFKAKKTLDLTAATIKEYEESLFSTVGLSVLPSAVLYGANSSGKSNLIEAIRTFLTTVYDSASYNSSEELPMAPFMFDEDSRTKPSCFEIELLIDDDWYRYGFSAKKDRICEEYLYFKTGNKGREKCLFVRSEDGIGVTSHYKSAEDMVERTRDNALFLSVADAFNDRIAGLIMRELKGFAVFDGDKSETLSEKAISISDDELNSFLSRFKLGFETIRRVDNPSIRAVTTHKVYDASGKVTGEISMSLSDTESNGTNKLFDMAPIFVKALSSRRVLVIDEFGSSMHPMITRMLISLFNSKETNPMGSQLIFTTHDTNLLDNKYLRRDQIWFTEKDETASTDLYSLVEFKDASGVKVRNDRSYEKDYINGRYGAIPYL